MKDMIFASHNLGKIKEMKEMLSPLGINVLTFEDIQMPDVEETGQTFEENAALKAVTIAKLNNVPCFADDSGLCVDCLGGRPGVFSARYAPNRDFQKAMQMLLGEMREAATDNRNAHFMCVIALGYPDGSYKAFQGRVDGTIANEPHGTNGLGFDPIFIPNGYNQTFAELGEDVKNTISHRAKALLQLTEFLKR